MKRSFPLFKSNSLLLSVAIILVVVVQGCTLDNSADKPLIILTHDSFDIGEDLITEFQRDHHAEVIIQKGGDAGEILTKAILTKDAPIADLIYGIDNTFLSRALNEDLFIPYRSPLIDQVPGKFHIDPEYRVTPIDYGYVAVNYDLSWIGSNQLTPPEDLYELTTEKWRGKLIVQNPATSSPGLAFLLITINRFGEEGDYTWKEYWSDLKSNDVKVSDGWSDAYYTAFSLWGGDRPLVVSYSTSPAAEVYYSEEPMDSPPTGVLMTNRSVFLQVETIGIVRGSKNHKLAERFIDYALNKRFQEDFPTRMWVYPVNKKALLPRIFEFAPEPDPKPEIQLNVSAEDLDEWISDWADIVIRR
jgi:thiamine transport system substrate-binding protein